MHFYCDTTTNHTTWDVPTAPAAGFCHSATAGGAPLVTASGLDAIAQEKAEDRNTAFKKACDSSTAKATRANDIKLFGTKERNAQLDAKRAQAAAMLEVTVVPQNIKIHSDDGSSEQEKSDELMKRAQAMVTETAGIHNFAQHGEPVFREGTQAVPPAACPSAEPIEVIV